MIVHSAKAEHFLGRDSIQAQSGPKVDVFDDPVLLRIASDIFRRGELEIVGNYAGLNMTEDIDAAIWTLEQAKAWAATRSGSTAFTSEWPICGWTANRIYSERHAGICSVI